MFLNFKIKTFVINKIGNLLYYLLIVNMVNISDFKKNYIPFIVIKIIIMSSNLYIY